MRGSAGRAGLAAVAIEAVSDLEAMASPGQVGDCSLPRPAWLFTTSSRPHRVSHLETSLLCVWKQSVSSLPMPGRGQASLLREGS